MEVLWESVQCEDTDGNVTLQVRLVTLRLGQGHRRCHQTDDPRNKIDPGHDDNPRVKRVLKRLTSHNGEVQSSCLDV
jgi:hypothetical protein